MKIICTKNWEISITFLYNFKIKYYTIYYIILNIIYSYWKSKLSQYQIYVTSCATDRAREFGASAYVNSWTYAFSSEQVYP